MMNNAKQNTGGSMSKVKALAVGTSLLAGLSTLPNVASADLSASVAVSNMYLWRGTNISNPGAAVSGSVDYSHDTGFYAGVWTSSEGATGSQEYDLYFGIAGEAGDFGYDLGFIEYVYPSEADEALKFDFSEIYLGLSFAGLSADIYIDTGAGDTDFGDSKYYFLAYEFGSFSFGVGGWSVDDSTGLDEYEHIDITYNATDELSFTVSQVLDEDDVSSGDNDALVAVTWSKSFDL